MDLATITDGADRFVVYVEEPASVIGHADRAAPLRDYCAALLTAEGRKSVEPMAAGDGACPRFGAASEALAFRRRSAAATLRKIGITAGFGRDASTTRNCIIELRRLDSEPRQDTLATPGSDRAQNVVTFPKNSEALPLNTNR